MPPLWQLVQAVAPDLTADVPGRVGTPQRQGVRLTPHDRAFHRAGLTDTRGPRPTASRPDEGGVPASGYAYGTGFWCGETDDALTPRCSHR
jgi:hypothetical protein